MSLTALTEFSDLWLETWRTRWWTWVWKMLSQVVLPTSKESMEATTCGWQSFLNSTKWRSVETHPCPDLEEGFCQEGSWEVKVAGSCSQESTNCTLRGNSCMLSVTTPQVWSCRLEDITFPTMHKVCPSQRLLKNCCYIYISVFTYAVLHLLTK